MKKETPETRIKDAVKSILTIEGFFHFPLTAGMGSYKGLPDRIAIKHGRTLYIELKAPGKSQSPFQKKFQADLIAAGCVDYFVVWTVDDLIRELKARGFNVRTLFS